VGDVGDVDTEEPVIPLQPLQRDRIVEVAGIDRIDGDDRPPRQIATIGGHLLGEPDGLRAGGVEDLLAERSGESELVDDRLRVDAGLAGKPENFDDHPFPVTEMGRETHDLDDDLVPLADRLGAGIADRHRSREGGAIDLHPAGAGGHEEAADEPGPRPRDDLDDLPTRTRAADVAATQQADADGVAVDGIETRRLGDMDIAVAVARRRGQRMDESVTSGGAAEHAEDVIAGAAGPAPPRGGRAPPAPFAVVIVAASLLVLRHRWPPLSVGNRPRRSPFQPRPRKNFRPREG
jgi:hypothetical protein